MAYAHPVRQVISSQTTVISAASGSNMYLLYVRQENFLPRMHQPVLFAFRANIKRGQVQPVALFVLQASIKLDKVQQVALHALQANTHQYLELLPQVACRAHLVTGLYLEGPVVITVNRHRAAQILRIRTTLLSLMGEDAAAAQLALTQTGSILHATCVQQENMCQHLACLFLVVCLARLAHIPLAHLLRQAV